MSEFPPRGSEERSEIEEIEAKLSDAGYELALSEETEGTWFAALQRHDRLGPAAAPFAAGRTAVEAARSAWLLYLSTPSLSSFKARTA
jgi:hypothetical protein